MEFIDETYQRICDNEFRGLIFGELKMRNLPKDKELS